MVLNFKDHGILSSMVVEADSKGEFKLKLNPKQKEF